jgi:DNA polymerase III subunit alpha
MSDTTPTQSTSGSPLLPQFVHLRLHSEFSITDGMVRLDAGKNHECPPVKRASEVQMPAVALTDLGNLFGLVKFYSAALSQGVKPIVGADCWIQNLEEPDRPYRLLVLVKHQKGYQQLCELLTKAHIRENRPEKAEIVPEWFAEIGSDGLIALSGAAEGDVGQALLSGNQEIASERAQRWAKIFHGSFYLEVQRYGQPNQEALVNATADLAGNLNIPLVATHPIQFMERQDFQAHEARICIAEGYALGDARRPRPYTEEQYFKSQQEMAALFPDLPEALANTIEIAKRCNISLTLGKNFLPDFPIPAGMTINEYLVTVTKDGLEKRLVELFPDAEERAKRRSEYDERLVFECNTIIQMGFPGYFLIVADFINWGKNNGVPVGPGRGSGAGSLVAYSLRITDIDPLAYALLFERFLNPERVSMPDFDIDFCQDNRWRVIEYVRQRYGEQAVSQIATFGTMSSKAVVRDVGRVLELPYSLCDRISKLIPVQANKPVSLAEALEQEPALREMFQDDRDGESIQKLFDLAQRLEDLTRNVGMHAGGVLIAPGKITDFCPIYQATGSDSSPVSQFDKDDVEKAGLVKFDFLGLRNLTIIQLALEYVEQLTGEKLDLMSLGFNDPAAYQILKDANTTAIFQVESEGMKKLLKKLAPDRFEDIIAVLALYRPGPLGSGMVDDFILRKKGQQKIDYFHPDLTACLSPTYGVIVYQEQVMQISQIIGGYTLGGADMLRRAMGKKKPEEMAAHRATIAEGAQKRGYDPTLAEQLFDLMTKFAEYGFNKSHTAAYAVVTYQTAWLKAHHTAAFMAATLSSDMDNTDTVKIFVDDTLKNKITLLGPDVNVSSYKFTPVDTQTIRYGLGAVKGTGEQAVTVILKARTQNGPFKDLFDFCLRVDKRQVNRRTIEALIRAGGFDGIDTDRAKLLGSVTLAMEAAEQAERNAHQGGLFDDAPAEESHAPTYLLAEPWGEKFRLMQEKQALGFFFSGHPYDSVKAELSACVRRSLNQLEPSKELTLLAGFVVGVRTQMTKRGKMLFLQLDDGTGMLEVSVFNELFEAEKAKIVTDEVLVVEGKVSYDDFSGGNRVVADKLMTLAEARGRFAKYLRINALFKCVADIQQLKRMLSRFPGGTAVRIQYQNSVAQCELVLGEDCRVTVEETLLDDLRGWLGRKNIELNYYGGS